MTRRPAAMVVLVFALWPFRAQAQDPWARPRELSFGTWLVITTTSGVLVEGGLVSIREEQVIVATSSSEQRQVARADIQVLKTTKRDPLWNGILAGTALGFGGGTGLGAAWYHGSGRYGAKPPGYEREFITGMGVVGGILGAIVGWRLDARRTRSEVIYQAPSVR